jgi:hypothetical protein
MAEKTVDVFQLLAALLLFRHLAQSGMASRAPFADHLPSRILNYSDPIRRYVRAKVIQRVQLAELSSLSSDNVWSRSQPLVMFGVEEVFCFSKVASQTRFCTLVMLEIHGVVVL